MNDPEAKRRQEVIVRMSPVCECAEHVIVKRVGRPDEMVDGCVDVLCRPMEPSLAVYTIAIEVKSHGLVGDGQLGPWLKQASDYVGAEPANRWPPVAASFVWLVGVPLHPSKEEQLRMDGMIQLGQHFRVGRAYEGHAGLTLVFGPSAEIYREKRGWSTRAGELLKAKRVSAGMRK